MHTVGRPRFAKATPQLQRIQRIPGRATRFLVDTRGTIALGAGAMMIVAALFAGVAIDFARGALKRQELNSAIDAAALALAASSLTDIDEMEELAEKYLEANYDSLASSSDIDLSVEVTEDTVAITATQEMPTTLMRLASNDTMTLQSYAEVSRSSKKTELVLVLDNTGSMASNDKLEALKEAATELIDALFADETEASKLKVGIVPFSTTVNVGSQYASETWLDHNGLNPISRVNFTDSSKHNSWAWGEFANMSWNGCVEQRRVASGTDYDIDDTVPTAGDPDTLFPIYFAPDEPSNSNRASSQSGWGNGFPNSYLADWRSDESVTTTAKRSASLDNRQRRYEKYVGTSPTGDGPGEYCTIAPLTPLTATKGTITDALDSMIADGPTNIAAGVGWGLRLLSPTVPFTEGAAFDDDDWNKVMVIMTDGDNNWGNSLTNMNGSYYSGYGYASQSWTRLGRNSISNLNEVFDERTAAACDAVKSAAGVDGNPVTIYTITFGTDLSETARTLMEECATDSERYFHAPDNVTLQDVFEEIASHIKEIYISK